MVKMSRELDALRGVGARAAVCLPVDFQPSQFALAPLASYSIV